MAELKQCEFFLLRYVPDAVKDEFVNIGVLLIEPGTRGKGFAEVKFTRDWQRVKCLDPAADLELLARLEDGLRARLNKVGAAEFISGVSESFSNLLQLSAAKYTHPGDPLKIDCGYRPNGELKLFHAVSLATDVDAAKVLAFSYPQIREGIARVEKITTSLTALVEDDLDRTDEPIAFALDTLARSHIAVAPQAELPRVAEVARQE